MTSTLLLAMILSLVGGGAVRAAPPTDADIVITSVTDQGTGVPTAIAGHPFAVGIALVDSAGNPYFVNKDTVISLSATGGTANLGGNTTGTVLKNQSTTTIFGVTYPKVENVTLQASGFKLATGSRFLSVQKEAQAISPTTPFVSTCGPGDPSTANPICSEVTFHNGVGSTGWFGVGPCVGFPGIDPSTCAPVEASLFSLIADFGDLYTRADPLTVIWNCHKSVCGTGGGAPTSGVPFAPLFVQLEDGGPFVESPACPSKGIVGPDQQFCTDYVQSGRSQGNLFLYLLFKSDPRYRG